MTIAEAQKIFKETEKLINRQNLTQEQWERYRQAIAVLRANRKPIANARDKSKLRERDHFAHHGYYVQQMISGEYVISKDGVHISYAKTKDDAKKIIDGLVNPRSARRNSAHDPNDELKFGEAQRIAKSFGHRLTNTGVDFKLTGKFFPTGYFTNSLDDAIGTLKFEISRSEKKSQRNPGKPVLIYGDVMRIEARKSQNHICDAECKKHGHRYFHDFTSKPKMYGLPDGSLLIKV